MKARVFFAGFFLLLHFQVSAQGWISGTVSDKTNGQPLAGALVLIQQNRGVAADASGYFLLWAEKPVVQLTFQMLGFKSYTQKVSPIASDTLRLKVELSPEVFDMDQVVVTASRIEQRLAELTVSMSVLKPQMVENRHTTDAEALINRVPGVDILDGQISIRGGSGFSYGAGSRVLALVDGLPALAADAGNIRWQYLPLDNLSQVEIIKGASSVAYGSSALNGVINFRTADATPLPQMKAYLQTGFFDRPANRLWKWWTTPRMSTSAGFDYLRRFGHNDLGIGFSLLSDNGYRKFNDEKLLRYHLKWKKFHSRIENLRYGVSLQGGFTDKTDFVLWENATTGALIQDSSTVSPMDGIYFTLDPFVTYDSQKGVRHELKSRLMQTENSFPTATNNNSLSRSAFVQYEIFAPVFSWLRLQSGVVQQSAQVISNFYGNHHSLNAAAFLQLESQPIPGLQLVAGTRMEYNSLDGGYQRFEPLFRTGLNYALGSATFLRASFGQGFRYPSIAERYASTTLGAVKIFPNIYIQPESGWNAELGFRQGIKTSGITAGIDLTAFYLQNKNMIEFLFGIYPDRNGSFGFGFKASNIEAARVYGAEAELTLAFVTGTFSHQLNGGYTYTMPVEYNPYTGKNSDNYLKYRRKHSVKLHWEMSKNRFGGGTSLSWQSAMLRIDKVFLDTLTREHLLPGFYEYWQSNNKPAFVADVFLAYNFSSHWKLSAMVNNLLNTVYMGRPGDIQPQRYFSIRLSWGK